MTPPVTRVLALLHLDGTDGPGERDRTVLAALRALAAHGGIEQVCLLHVIETGRRLPFRTEIPRRDIDDGRPALFDHIAADLDAALPDTRVVAFGARGRVIEEIARINEREGCDLVVLARGRTETGVARWGDHGLRILRLADAAVLVLPEGVPLILDRAVVGMDLSPHAMTALAVATTLCSRVEALAVLDAAGEGLHTETLGAVEAEMREAYTRQALAALRALAPGPSKGGEDLPAPPLRVLDAANPADALLSAGADADLLVVGSRGLTPLAAVLLGSTAERLGGRCERPLLVWRTRGQQQGLFEALFGKRAGGVKEP